MLIKCSMLYLLIRTSCVGLRLKVGLDFCVSAFTIILKSQDQCRIRFIILLIGYCRCDLAPIILWRVCVAALFCVLKMTETNPFQKQLKFFTYRTGM